MANQRKSDVRKAAEGDRAAGTRAGEGGQAGRAQGDHGQGRPQGAEEDPDIAGIVPGPQPLPYDLLEEEAVVAAVEEEKKP